MGELKAEGRIRTTEELHTENVARQREVNAATQATKQRWKCSASRVAKISPR